MKNRFLRIGLALGGALAAWGVAPNAWAGVPGTIDYGPLPMATSVPTLGEWALVLMALLVMVVAYRALRGRVNGRLLTHLLLGGGLAAGGLASGHWVQSAQAVVDPEVLLTVASGGSVNVIQVNVPVKVTNNAGVALQIKALHANYEGVSWVEPNEGAPQCQVGTVLQAGGSCYVQLAAELG